MLEELNQPVSENKALLINRILEFAGDDFLGLHCPEKLYKPSMNGLSFLEKYEDYVQVHTHKN